MQVISQRPAVQVGAPLAGVAQGSHRSPQEARASLARQRSPHRWKPAAQVITHRPAAHATAPLAGVGQGWQRSPHEATASLRAQRSAQRWVPAGQVKSQVAVAPMRVQRAVAPAGATQGWQRVPHEAGLLSWRQAVAQRWVPAGHGVRQRPSMHCDPAAQVTPQAPQWALSTLVSTHPTVGQCTCDSGQAHAPSRHHAPAAQALPQRPQCSESLRLSTQRSAHCEARSAGHWQAPPRQLRPEPCAPHGVSAGSSSKTHTRSVASQRSATVHGSSSRHPPLSEQGRTARQPRVRSHAAPAGQSPLEGECSQRPERQVSTVHETPSLHSPSVRHPGGGASTASLRSSPLTASVGLAASREGPPTTESPEAHPRPRRIASGVRRGDIGWSLFGVAGRSVGLRVRGPGKSGAMLRGSVRAANGGEP
nr:hypothetical protein [Deltaproteobacteria bacterium]